MSTRIRTPSSSSARHRPVTAVTAVALLATLVLPAALRAGQANFHWNDCAGDGGVSGVRFDCGSSNAVQTAIGSFVLDQAMPDFVALEIIVDLETASSQVAVPAWWSFAPSPTPCRGSSLTMTYDFAGFANNTCVDPFALPRSWERPPQGVLANYTISSNRARIIGVVRLLSEVAMPLDAGVEYYGFAMGLKLDKATGPDSCAGCATPVHLVISSLRALGISATSDENCYAWTYPGRIDWQCASCATPALSRTWGQVKGLYR
jgi:hypothetical protein